MLLTRLVSSNLHLNKDECNARLTWKKISKEALKAELACFLNATGKSVSLANLKITRHTGAKLSFVLKSSLFTSEEQRRLAILWLLEKFPGGEKKCLNCKSNKMASKGHMISCMNIMDNIPHGRRHLSRFDEMLHDKGPPEIRAKRFQKYCLLISRMVSACLGVETIPCTPPPMMIVQKKEKLTKAKMMNNMKADCRPRRLVEILGIRNQRLLLKSRPNMEEDETAMTRRPKRGRIKNIPDVDSDIDEYARKRPKSE